jgi:hypothetical protein
MKRLLWISDAHLDQLAPAAQRVWFDLIGSSNADMLLIGGDVTVAPHLTGTLRKIAVIFGGTVVFVAGNHDYYGSDTAGIRVALAKTDEVIAFEPGCWTEPLLLEPDVFLCGSGGWGDARAGTAADPVMPLPDETFIADLGARKLAIRLGQFGCRYRRPRLPDRRSAWQPRRPDGRPENSPGWPPSPREARDDAPPARAASGIAGRR